MIIAERRPLPKILKNIEPYRKILVLGCRGCVAICSAGGDREVAILAEAIRLARERAGNPVEVLEETFIRQCDPEYLTTLGELGKQVDAIVSLACGVGVNFIADLYPEVRIFPGVDTTFYGANVALGEWIEKCRGCGECIIDMTGGLCPIARCAKVLLNGPCGGSQNGRCEVREDMPCVWHLIVERLTKRGELDRLMEIWGPKDWRASGGEGLRVRERSDLKV
ncbi:MAG: methylenetetrahydrofolate reductase C-terminal domain-containing protein [Thermodesulfobacteriaceae bacterium]|nr:methylenetetrahydrofolate reductase C-terminal domain-containing protein [Thermodesulfobacteriaceae bacterium]MCX8041422.1 methylenetetrahydrofolate reductase C-terminal domain-containing protein [Thermodesulfobacteriaceae bacterium]MDW8135409.1 methylenetetrahydrofolate reductase C-terminal domain-containing protein [Thermodesulfobacterium sp.]